MRSPMLRPAGLRDWRRRQDPLLLRSFLLPALSGVLYFVSWIGFGIWPLAFVCFVPHIYALSEATGKQALRRGSNIR